MGPALATGLALALAALVPPWSAAADLAVPGTGIHLAEPAGWPAIDPLPGVPWRWRSPDRTGGIAVSATAVLPETGPAQAARQALTDLEKYSGRFAIIDWDFSQVQGAVVWSRLHYRHEFAGETWEQELWITVDRQRQLVVAGGAHPADFPRMAAVLRGMLAPAGASGPRLATP